MKIDEELKSRFANSLVKAHVNILFTANKLNYEDYKALKPFGISIQQFNILRILRGQGDKPVNLKLLTSRMIDRVSNTSRLVDKLVDKGLVERSICETHRRKVDICITKKGLNLVEEASVVMENLHKKNNSLSDKELETLSELLDRFRA